MYMFTEHNEVVMSVDNLRELLRYSFLHGYHSESNMYPSTFLAESFREDVEKKLRANIPLNPGV
jgi:hypothetical protein